MTDCALDTVVRPKLTVASASKSEADLRIMVSPLRYEFSIRSVVLCAGLLNGGSIVRRGVTCVNSFAKDFCAYLQNNFLRSDLGRIAENDEKDCVSVGQLSST